MPAPTTVAELQERFGIAGILRFETGTGGLARAVVTARPAEAHVYLHGAHVTHYQPRGQAPLLFMSGRSLFLPGKAIRGGVPVIFPWFGARAGDPAAPAHGFARAAPWQVESAGPEQDGSVAITFTLPPDPAARARWPHACTLRYRVAIGPALDLGLETHNTGSAAFTFEAALHTYLAVGDVRQTSVTGLAGATYIDKTDGMTRKQEGAAPIRVTGETDRVYLDSRPTCTLDDPAGGRRVVVEKHRSGATVVWNPWAEKARALADFGDDEWTAMLCIETANAADAAVTLAPGQRHLMRAVIRSEPREAAPREISHSTS